MITLTINGREYTLGVDPDTPLLWVLREELRLTGTKYACGLGRCGSCTILLADSPVRSCLTPLRAAAGKEIITIEGVPSEHPVKQAWIREQVSQCGYCQPGFIMQTIGLLQQRGDASCEELVNGLKRNLCRCGTYPRIKRALQSLTNSPPAPFLALGAPQFSETPHLGEGFGLTVTPAPNGFTLAAVSRRHSVLEPPVWLWLTPDNLLTLVLSKSEMGQGVFTALAMAAAEELDLPWELLRLEAAPAGQGYEDPAWRVQLTGGSSSISHLYEVFRHLGAATREMLLAAAAQEWAVPVALLQARQGVIRHPNSQRQADYGHFWRQAAAQPVPAAPKLKEPADYRYLAKELPRIDAMLKVNGAASFGWDHCTTPMLYAALARPPAYGAQLLDLNSGPSESLPGVRRVVRLDHSAAILADTPEAAWKGRDLLRISWSSGSHPELDDARLEKFFLDHLDRPGVVARQSGEADQALKICAQSLEVEYFLPYLAHATLEPMNCLADVRPESCEIWAPLQNQSRALHTVRELTGLPPERILIHTTFIGGGFGRRLETDYVTEAVRLSQVAGQPVKLVWTREEDFRYDFFRPMTASRIRAGMNEQGRLQVWDHTIAAPSIAARTRPHVLKTGIDPDAVDGLRNLAYDIPHVRITYVRVDLPIPVGPWRSVGNSHNAFTLESGIDELAHLANQDPLEFRLAHLALAPRAGRVLAAAAEKAGWGKPLPPGRALGIAQHFCFGSYVAQVAEVSVAEETGEITVTRVVCAVDCGTVVNPDTVRAQMEGGILFGLGAALREQVRFAQGGVKTLNFADYPLLTIQETPEIEVQIIAQGDSPGGIGEPGVPPIAPAVANAVFAATGRRWRRLPLCVPSLHSNSEW